MSLERIPQWRVRRMNTEQRAAYDRLRWHSPGPAERARLKRILALKRTTDETVALARELLADGRMVAAAADELGVGARYLKRLLDKSPTPQKRGRNPFIQAAEVAPTRETKVEVSRRPVYDGDALAYDLAGALNGGPPQGGWEP